MKKKIKFKTVLLIVFTIILAAMLFAPALQLLKK